MRKILIATIVFVVVTTFLISYICFHITFYVSRKKNREEDKYNLPKGKCYEPYYENMRGWIDDMRGTPCKHVYITSFDGLRLHGRYYEGVPKAPIEIMFHGYRGTAERDMCGGARRAFAVGRNALIVDQRTSGESEGRVISFGINERKDCLAWISYVIEHFGDDVEIILTGISMGAATVLMAAGMDLPKNVVGVLADSGYSSPRDIIKKVIRQLSLPASLLYPFVRLGARIYGGFHLEEASPVEAMKKCRVPVMFVHGEADDFVPCSMSKINYEACASRKGLLTISGAGHGIGCMVDWDLYIKALEEFFG